MKKRSNIVNIGLMNVFTESGFRMKPYSAVYTILQLLSLLWIDRFIGLNLKLCDFVSGAGNKFVFICRPFIILEFNK